MARDGAGPSPAADGQLDARDQNRQTQGHQPHDPGLVEGSRPVFAQEDQAGLPGLRLSRHLPVGRAAVALGHALPQLRLARAAPADPALSRPARHRPDDQEDPAVRPREMADAGDEEQSGLRAGRSLCADRQVPARHHRNRPARQFLRRGDRQSRVRACRRRQGGDARNVPCTEARRLRLLFGADQSQPRRNLREPGDHRPG